MDIESIKLNEASLVNLLSESLVKDGYTHFYDSKLVDMYDHNFNELYIDFRLDLLDEFKEIKDKFNEPHIKISSLKEIPELEQLGYSHECLLTMASDIVNVKPIELNGVVIKNLKNSREIANDILTMEMKYYGDIYGRSFTARRMYRYFALIQEKNGLDYFACYFNNKLIAYAYTYFDHGVVALDGLLVEEEYRNKRVASNLIKYVQQYYGNCPIYLHADLDETAKDLYTKLGFKIIAYKHDYLLVDKK